MTLMDFFSRKATVSATRDMKKHVASLGKRGEKVVSRELSATDKYGCTPLILAVRRGVLEEICMILDLGADPNTSDMFQATPLMVAVHHEESLAMQIADLLIERGALINVKSHHNFSPFLFAAAEGNIQLCRRFVDLGADPNETTDHGHNALHLLFLSAAKTDARRHSVALLVEKARSLLDIGVNPADQAKRPYFLPSVQVEIPAGATCAHVARLVGAEMPMREACCETQVAI